MSKKKLTPLQKETLQHMAQGRKLILWKGTYYYSHLTSNSVAVAMQTVLTRTVKSLETGELILWNSDDLNYEITDAGRAAIVADHDSADKPVVPMTLLKWQDIIDTQRNTPVWTTQATTAILHHYRLSVISKLHVEGLRRVKDESLIAELEAIRIAVNTELVNRGEIDPVPSAPVETPAPVAIGMSLHAMKERRQALELFRAQMTNYLRISPAYLNPRAWLNREIARYDALIETAEGNTFEPNESLADMPLRAYTKTYVQIREGSDAYSPEYLSAALEREAREEEAEKRENTAAELATLKAELAASNARIAELTIEADMVDTQECPVCAGFGFTDPERITDRCSSCGGTGKVSYAFLAGYYRARLDARNIILAALVKKWTTDANTWLLASEIALEKDNRAKAEEWHVLHTEILKRVAAIETVLTK